MIIHMNIFHYSYRHTDVVFDGQLFSYCTPKEKKSKGKRIWNCSSCTRSCKAFVIEEKGCFRTSGTHTCGNNKLKKYIFCLTQLIIFSECKYNSTILQHRIIKLSCIFICALFHFSDPLPSQKP